MIVFSFDRDHTIDVSKSELELVPLEWVHYLRDETEHEVWTHDYRQDLRHEADLPGIAEALEIFTDRYGDPADLLEKRPGEKLEKPVNQNRDDSPAPRPDVVTALYNWQEHGETPKRYLRLRIIGQIFPEAEHKICIDNVYLNYLHNWTHYYPWTFTDFVEEMVEMAGASELELTRKVKDGDLKRVEFIEERSSQPTTTAEVLHLVLSKIYGKVKK